MVDPRYFLLALATAFAGCSANQPTEPPRPQQADLVSSTVWVEVEVSGWDSLQGNCRVAAYTSADGFQVLDRAVAKAVVPIDGESVRWSFSYAPTDQDQTSGVLAISAYQDRNDNSQLDKNVFGIPTERYGFSNQPKRGYGPPKFDQAALAQPEQTSEQNPWRIRIVVQ